MGKNFEFDVLLSHSSKDKPRVRKVAELLRAAGLKVWFDEQEIAYGEHIYLAVERGLEQSRILLLFLSKTALQSDWVGLERSTALFRDPVNTERRFVPVLLEDCDLPDTLKGFKYVDFRTDTEETQTELVAAAQGKLGAGGFVVKRRLPAKLLWAGGLLACLVLWGILAPSKPPPATPFLVTFFVHGKGGIHDLPLRGKGSVFLDLGQDRRQEPIGEKGQAIFAGIPASFRGRKVAVGLTAEGFQLAQTLRRVQLDAEVLYLPVDRLSFEVRGQVRDEMGRPIAGAAIHLRDLETRTAAAGSFTLAVPGEWQAEDLSLRVAAPGFAPWQGQVLPNSNEIDIQLERAKT